MRAGAGRNSLAVAARGVSWSPMRSLAQQPRQQRAAGFCAGPPFCFLCVWGVVPTNRRQLGQLTVQAGKASQFPPLLRALDLQLFWK